MMTPRIIASTTMRHDLRPVFEGQKKTFLSSMLYYMNFCTKAIKQGINKTMSKLCQNGHPTLYLYMIKISKKKKNIIIIKIYLLQYQ